MHQAVEFPKFRWFVALALAFAWFSFGSITMSFAPLLPIIAKEFGTEVGSLMVGIMAVNSFAMGFGVVLSGPMIDKFGPRKVLLVSSIWVAAYCALLPFATHSVGAIVALRIFQGFGSGPVMASMAAVSNRWFPQKEQGIINGLTNAAIAIGFAVTFVSLPHLIQAFHGSWRMALGTTTVLLVIQTILMAITLLGKEPAHAGHAPAHAEADAGSGNDFVAVLKSPAFWICTVLLSIAQSTLQSFNGLTPTYLTAPPAIGLGIKPMVAGSCQSLVQLGGIVSGLMMGFIMQVIFRGKPKWVAVCGLSIGGLLISALNCPLFHTQMPVLSVYLFIVGMFMSLAFPSVSVFIATNFPPHVLGKVFATASGLSIFGGAALSAISGVILDKTHTFVAVFGFLLAIGFIGAALGCLLGPVKLLHKQHATE